jgi:hypothetical protein
MLWICCGFAVQLAVQLLVQQIPKQIEQVEFEHMRLLLKTGCHCHCENTGQAQTIYKLECLMYSPIVTVG